MTLAERLLDAAEHESFELRALLEEAAAALSARGWQPIETAPTNGDRLLLALTNKQVVIGRWTEDDAKQPCTPTHWMPLPEPPVST